MCGEKEYNVSEWKKVEKWEYATHWQRSHVLEKYYWGTCVRKNPTFRPKWKPIILLLLVVMAIISLVYILIFQQSYPVLLATTTTTISIEQPER